MTEVPSKPLSKHQSRASAALFDEALGTDGRGANGGHDESAKMKLHLACVFDVEETFVPGNPNESFVRFPWRCVFPGKQGDRSCRVSL